MSRSTQARRAAIVQQQKERARRLMSPEERRELRNMHPEEAEKTIAAIDQILDRAKKDGAR